MIYEMNLNKEPFELIKSKRKVIEMRLNDERRKKIKANDIIIFSENSSKEQLKCIVEEVKSFKNFFKLYEYYDKILLGYKNDEIASADDMLKYYKLEK